MNNLSLPLLLAWDIAANEAAHARSKVIEPDHLFIGLCKLEDFASATPLIDLGYDPTEAEVMQPEIGALTTLFYQFNLSPATIRRELRQRKSTGMLNLFSGWGTGILGQADKSANATVIHRSPAAKQAFFRASEFAAIGGAVNVSVFHLMAALLDDTSASLPQWLRRFVDVNALRTAALEAQPFTRRS